MLKPVFHRSQSESVMSQWFKAEAVADSEQVQNARIKTGSRRFDWTIRLVALLTLDFVLI